MTKSIVYWNRSARKMETEKVYGDALVRWIYTTRTGKLAAKGLLVRSPLSKVYGAYQSTRLSASQVPGFIQKFDIPMEQYETPDGGFRTFNEFFIRKFRPGMRLFVAQPRAMAAFAEARYLAFDRIRDDQVFPVKGHGLGARELLGSAELAAPFMGGPLLLARLCPVDYHRFHFPDAGKVSSDFRIPGKLHSVNPLALQALDEVFIENERHVTILETEHFGRLAYIEVGAMGVGKIVQTHSGKTFKRGEEKGYFLFGASTVIVLGEPGKWRPERDLLEQTSKGIESLIRLGDEVAQAG